MGPIRYLYTFIFAGLGWVCSSFSNNQPQINKHEAQIAFEYLNQLRTKQAEQDPKIDDCIKQIKAQAPLTWNPILAKVAEEKALDMATRSYFNHVTPEGYGINMLIDQAGFKLPAEWTNAKSNNYFESLQAGATNGINAVKDLIIDEDVPSKGHRSHLLGGNEFNAKNTDIGIGFVQSNGGLYYSYTCIIIARHNW